jgi:dipeptide/tripeptide permease
MSGDINVSPAGVSMMGKIALPSARAWVNSAKHHLESSQLGVWMMTMASDRSISR